MIGEVEELNLGDHWRFRHLTITGIYDPSDPGSLCVEGIRDRIAGFKRIWSRIWNRSLKAKNAGAFTSIEIAGTGNVHMHVLYFGPWVDEGEVNELARQAWPRAGWVKIQAVDGFDGAREVCKYSMKSPGGAAEGWLRGQPVEIIHPALAARWELAISGRRTQERYGAFRAVSKPVDDWEDPGDQEVTCPHCGRVGEYHWRSMPADIWIRWLHGLGHKALRAGRAPPGGNNDD